MRNNFLFYLMVRDYIKVLFTDNFGISSQQSCAFMCWASVFEIISQVVIKRPQEGHKSSQCSDNCSPFQALKINTLESIALQCCKP